MIATRPAAFCRPGADFLSGLAAGGYYAPRNMLDDAELLRRYAQDRSEPAFTELVERHLSLVYYAALRRIGQAQLAEDAAQYVFIALARNASALSRHAVLTGWLYTTTRFAANRILRVERRRQFREQEAYSMENVLSPPDLDWDRLRPALDGVMDQLSDRDRAAVLLRYFEGRSFADVGRALELTEEAARKRVERGLERMRSLLVRRGVSSTSTALALVLSSQSGLAAPTGLAATVSGSALAAGGSVMSSALVGLIGVMSTTKAILGIAGALSLFALGTAGYEWRAERRANQSIAAEIQELDLRSKHLNTLTQRAAMIEKEIIDLRKSVAASKPKSATPTKWDAVAEGRKFMAVHPEARSLLEKLGQYMVAVDVDPFLRTLGLPPDRLQQIEDKLLKIPSILTVPSPSGEVILALDDKAPLGASRSDAFRAAMGESTFQQFQDYSKERNRLSAATYVTDRVASDTYFTATPLTSGQASQLTRILAENSSESQDGGAATRVAAIDWDTVLKQAKDVLSPAQLASLEVSKDDQVYVDAMQAARQGASGGQNPANSISN
jgi:RNA polymerase sigma factor (sigma-70 family)